MLRTVIVLLALLLATLPGYNKGQAFAQSAPPAAAKDQSQLGIDGAPGTGDQGEGEEAQPALPDDENGSLGEADTGDIPDVQVIALTADIARRAIDVYALINEKYKDDNLEDYESLDDFVSKAPRGKELAADVTVHGFTSVNDWNAAITTVGLAYGAVTNHQADDVQGQIDDIEKDTSLDPAMKERMVASLKAMIPSPENRQIITELMKDEAYAAKLKLLDQEQ